MKAIIYTKLGPPDVLQVQKVTQPVYMYFSLDPFTYLSVLHRTGRKVEFTPMSVNRGKIQPRNCGARSAVNYLKIALTTLWELPRWNRGDYFL
ncbi:hypothetical protein ACFLS9_03465 [Bacteroidota bacterium]